VDRGYSPSARKFFFQRGRRWLGFDVGPVACRIPTTNLGELGAACASRPAGIGDSGTPTAKSAPPPKVARAGCGLAGAIRRKTIEEEYHHRRNETRRLKEQATRHLYFLPAKYVTYIKVCRKHGLLRPMTDSVKATRPAPGFEAPSRSRRGTPQQPPVPKGRSLLTASADCAPRCPDAISDNTVLAAPCATGRTCGPLPHL
jgi:hypothetical protein